MAMAQAPIGRPGITFNSILCTGMNLWFRMTKILLLTWIWRRPFALTDVSRLKFRVWPLDLDMNFHVNNGRYLALMDLGRVDLMVRAGVFRKAIRRGWTPVVASIHITFRHSLYLWQHFHLRTKVVGWDEKWFYIEQDFSAGGKLAARALVKAALRTRGGTVPTNEVLALAGFGPGTPVIELPKEWADLVAADAHLNKRLK